MSDASIAERIARRCLEHCPASSRAPFPRSGTARARVSRGASRHVEIRRSRMAVSSWETSLGLQLFQSLLDGRDSGVRRTGSGTRPLRQSQGSVSSQPRTCAEQGDIVIPPRMQLTRELSEDPRLDRADSLMLTVAERENQKACVGVDRFTNTRDNNDDG